MTIVPVGVDAQGNINIAELKQKAEQHKVRRQHRSCCCRERC